MIFLLNTVYVMIALFIFYQFANGTIQMCISRYGEEVELSELAYFIICVISSIAWPLVLLMLWYKENKEN